jgi:hypothetical protein
MRILKNIFHLTIALAILATGFPMLRGDVNLDKRLDLADAVLSVRGVARSVDNPAVFEKNIENAIISLAAAAGVQKVIKADAERASGNVFTATPPAALLASFLPGVIFQSGIHPADAPFLYKSVYLTPATPPPLCA